MVEHSSTERIFQVHALHTFEVACHLSNALLESHDAVIEEDASVVVGRVGIGKSWRGREEE